jgi:hypothetical protein
MSRDFGRKGAVLLALSTLLGGCVSFDRRDWTMADAGSGGMFRAAWGGMRSDAVPSSETVRRIRGMETPRDTLELEPGNVWPAEEAPRATLANPDAALRGVPPYRPGEARDPARLRDEDGRYRDPGPRADAVPPADLRPPPRRRRGASPTPPPPLDQPETSRVEVLPVPPGAYAPPPRRADGQVVLTPGGPVVTTGGTPNVQGFTTPGGGGGVIHRDGGVTTIVPSGGTPQSFPTPR